MTTGPPGGPGRMGNRLLDALSPEDRSRLVGAGQRVRLDSGQVIYHPNRPIPHVVFPLTGSVSLINTLQSGASFEVGSIGNEGLVGIPVFLGPARTRLWTVCQVPGEGIRVPADAFRAELARNTRLRDLLGRYTQALLAQIAQSATCSAFHSPRQRLARWLLMMHDRASSGRFHLTHEFLSQMLGVRRATVSEHADDLRRDGLISYSRGEVVITDRAGLERASCECYQDIRIEYARLLGAD